VSTVGIPSEILPMVEGINGLLGRIEQAFAVQQRFLANAAHELKTPLSILRGELELRLDADEGRALLQEVDTMARTVTQLLQLAEAADLGGYRFTRVVLADVAAEAAALVEGLARSRGVALRREVDARDSAVDGDRAAIQIALRNLLENAIQHSPPEATVELHVQEALITVGDAGPGLDEETRAHLFERFWRRDRSGAGTGLGLAIVKEIMQAHGGEVHAGNREDGQGALFTLEFPSRRTRAEQAPDAVPTAAGRARG
jgi:signal transduction histidine kinase